MANDIKLIIITKSSSNTVISHISFIINKINYSFQLMQSPTGCGLGLFANFISNLIERLKSKEVIDIFKLTIKNLCLPPGICCVIATLGDSHKQYEPFLIELGFVEIHKYANSILHSSNYIQRVYQLDVTKL